MACSIASRTIVVVIVEPGDEPVEELAQRDQGVVGLDDGAGLVKDRSQLILVTAAPTCRCRSGRL